LISEQAALIDSDLIKQDWALCLRTNSSYHDCPVSDYADKENYNMYAMIHQTSTILDDVVTLSVPHANFNVQTYTPSQGYKDTKAKVYCFLDRDA
jgi:hypothetical protein